MTVDQAINQVSQKVVQSGGKWEVLAPPYDLELVETAGRTCYQSNRGQPVTRETVHRFVKMLIKRGHESVLEHLSHCVDIVPGHSLQDELEFQTDMIDLLLNTVGMHATRRCSGAWLVSANARTVRDAVRRCPNNELTKVLHSMFAARWPEPFEDFEEPRLPSSRVMASPMEDDDVRRLDVHHRLEHLYATVRFADESRGFTHELVRHRLCAFSQESTRYVDEGGSAWVAAPSMDLSSPVKVEFAGTTLCMTRVDMAEMEYAFYRACREAGDPPQDARQLLPIGTTSEIVVSCNLREWRQIFRMRCARPAHWEIRALTVYLCLDFQKRFPGCFDGFFVAGVDDDGVLYMEVPNAL